MSAGAGDIDGDGDIDLYVSHLDGELNRLYVNEGKRLFTDATITSGLGTTTIMNSGFGAQFLDADNDGSRDLVVVNGHILDNIAIYHAGRDPRRGQEALPEPGRRPLRRRHRDAARGLPRAARGPRPGGGRLRQRRVPGRCSSETTARRGSSSGTPAPPAGTGSGFGWSASRACATARARG